MQRAPECESWDYDVEILHLILEVFVLSVFWKYIIPDLYIRAISINWKVLKPNISLTFLNSMEMKQRVWIGS